VLSNVLVTWLHPLVKFNLLGGKALRARWCGNKDLHPKGEGREGKGRGGGGGSYIFTPRALHGVKT